jgi:hypothetical protein
MASWPGGGLTMWGWSSRPDAAPAPGGSSPRSFAFKFGFLLVRNVLAELA